MGFFKEKELVKSAGSMSVVTDEKMTLTIEVYTLYDKGFGEKLM